MRNKRINPNNTNLDISVGAKYGGNPRMQLHQRLKDYAKLERQSRTTLNINELIIAEEGMQELIDKYPNELRGQVLSKIIKSYK